MNFENSVCSLCWKNVASTFSCTSPVIYLCEECVISRSDQTLGKEPATPLSNQQRFYTIPGYLSRLQARVASFPTLKQQALQGSEAIDRVAREYKLQVDKAISKLVASSEEVARKLSELRETLNREMQAAVEEVEMTLEEDQPQLRTQYGPLLRQHAETRKQLQLLSFSIETCAISPQDWVTLQIQLIQVLPPNTPHRQELEPDMLSQEAKLKLSQLPPFSYSKGARLGERREPVVESNKDVYIGEWLNGQRHGQGKVLTTDGGLMEGHWENGLLHGKGREVHPCGDMYEGDFFKGTKTGFGCFEDLQRKAYYEGRWLNDKKHGKGIEHLDDGSVFEGSFESNLRSGFGVFSWASGESFEGEFRENMIHGRGKYVWKTDTKWYDGEWREGKMHGKGKFVNEGKEYEGDFVEDQKHGKGIYKWDGNVYEGDFFKNKMHGKGYLMMKGKERYLYAFENNKRGARLTI